MIREGLYRYVRHTQVNEYHKNGWMIVATLGPTHGAWSVLMWHCECEINDDPTSLPKNGA